MIIGEFTNVNDCGGPFRNTLAVLQGQVLVILLDLARNDRVLVRKLRTDNF